MAFLNPNIFGYLSEKVFSIQIYLDIQLVNCWASKYIRIFFWTYFMCYFTICWPVMTNLERIFFDQFWYDMTCFSKDTQIWLINVCHKRACIFYLYSYWLLFLRPNIFRYLFGELLGIQIFLDICSVHSWTYEYIWIFIRSIIWHPNILQYLFKQIWWYLLITASEENKHLNKINHKYCSYSWPFIDPNIFRYSFKKFFCIQLLLDICLVNCWAYKYIRIFHQTCFICNFTICWKFG